MLALTLSATLLSPPQEPPRHDAEALAAALELRLTYPYSLEVGKPRHVGHCRRAPAGCRARTEAFATAFVDAGRRTGVSPWLLAAMALRESGCNPFASGGAGEVGLLQIHPKRRDARTLRFLRDERYRERCREEIGACQAEVIDLAADVLRRSIEMCGDVEQGLAAYNTGRCDATSSYPRRVARELARLYSLAGQEVAS